MGLVVYGIKNCNTVKKVFTFLKQNSMNVEFHDYKSQGITKAKLEAWCQAFGWEVVLNKKGTTWRTLSDEEKAHVTNAETAIPIMLQHTSCIKRPIIELHDKPILIGFNEEEYLKQLK
jgi:arsenate reductase